MGPPKMRRLARFRGAVFGVPAGHEGDLGVRAGHDGFGEVLGLDAAGGLTDATAIQPLSGDVFAPGAPMGSPIPLARLTLLPPTQPTKVIGIGSNYRAHAAEMGKTIPPTPKMFLKAPSAVIGSGGSIVLPPGTERVDHEAELGVVIGRRASRVPRERAHEFIAGYTVVNDVTARDFQRADGVFSRAKGFDTFCPLGPWLAVGLDPADLRVWSTVNGLVRQDGRTSDMAFDVPTLLAFVSDVMTLLPGDVIATGTPSGVGPLVPGDRVTVGVDGIGALHNLVVARDDRTPRETRV
jgi:2-keto-4-pentenoate hydratase/2-oxohepta-3-ene-1,7-dioic acid hydratase in catechol pathway